MPREPIPEDLKQRYDHLGTYKPMEVAVTTIYIREWQCLIERIGGAEESNRALKQEVERLGEETIKLKDSPAKIYPLLVVTALIVRAGKVLLERRAPSGVKGLDDFWDLPGGKVECNEFPEDAIVREIREELGIVVTAEDMFPPLRTSTWVYADGERRHWILAVYKCSIVSGEIDCNDRLQWFDIDSLDADVILDADLQIIEAYRKSIVYDLQEELPALKLLVRDLDRENDRLKHSIDLMRKEIAEPSHDIQEWVLQKHNVRTIVHELQEELSALKEENKRVFARLDNANDAFAKKYDDHEALKLLVREMGEALKEIVHQTAGREWGHYGYYRAKQVVISEDPLTRYSAAVSDYECYRKSQSEGQS